MNERAFFSGKRIGLLALAIAILFNAIALYPEIRINRAPLNDEVIHLPASERLVDSLGKEPFLDPWVSTWALGYPIWRSYQPLPHLVAGAVMKASPAEHVVVFAWLQYLLLVLLPLSIFFGGRLLGLGPPAAGLAALLSVAPSGIDHFGSYGLGYGAFVWRGSGLYTQLFALHLMVLTIGIVARALDGKRRVLSSAMLALTALSHIIFGYVAFASAGLLALCGDRPRRLARFFFTAVPALVAIAWFVIPLFLSRHEIAHNRWEASYKWDSFGAPVILRALANGTLLDFGRWPTLTILLAAGTLSALLHFREPMARRLLLLAGFWLCLFFGRDTWGHLLSLVGIPADFHLHRLQAAFELFAIYCGAWGIVAAIGRVERRLVTGALTVALALLFIPMGYERAAYLEQNRKWGDDNLAAWKRERPDWEAALSDIRTILSKRPGRVSAGLAGGWGRTFAVGSVPTFALLSLAQLDEPSMLYHSMSLPSETMVLRDDDDPAEAAAFGVRVLVMPADRPAPPWLQRRGLHGRFAVYEASSEGYFGIVDPVARYLGPAPTRYEINQSWLKGPLARAGQVILFDARGPELPLLRRWDPLPAAAPLAPAGVVLSESQSGETHRARLSLSRSAFALVKLTWFPDLHATVDGHEAPLLRATPEFGVVAVPAGDHELEVSYQPGPLKPILFVLGLLFFVGFALMRFDENALAGRLERITLSPRVVSALGVTALIVVALHPLLRGKLMDGHDSTAYPPRLVEMAEVLRDGQLPPVWAPDLSSGHGQPLFEFAPPLLYFAAIPFLRLGIADAYQLGLLLLFSLGAAALFRLSRRLGASREVAWCVVAAWLFMPYVDLDLFVRGAFAEAAALAVAPVALAGLFAALDEPSPRRIALGAVAVSLIPLAHDGAALLLFPALGGFALAHLLVAENRRRPAVASTLVFGGGLALSAFFWLPAFVEKAFTQVHLLKEEALRWSDHAIEPWQLFSASWGYGTSNVGSSDGMSFQLGWMHLALGIAGAWLAWRSRDPRRRALSLAGSALVFSYAFLSTGWSSAIWSHVETLQYLAYPWRALMVPALFLPVLALGAFERLPLRWLFVPCAALIAFNLSHTEPRQYLTYDEEFYSPNRIARNGLNVSMREEYTPMWVEARPPFQEVQLIPIDAPIQVTSAEIHTARQKLVVNVQSQTRVLSRISYFPGWKVKIDGAPAKAEPEPHGGRILFSLPAGRHEVAITLETTAPRKTGIIISILSAILLAGATLRRRRTQQVAAPAPNGVETR